MLIKIGSIRFNVGTISITDPCYDNDIWCRISESIVPGKYDVYIKRKDVRYGPYQANRVALLRIVLDEPDVQARVRANRSWRRIPNNFVGVDAGLAGFFQNKPNFGNKEWDRFVDDIERQDDEKAHSDLTRLSYFYEDESKNALGVFSSTGDGDGSYPVYRIREERGNGRRSVALEIRYF